MGGYVRRIAVIKQLKQGFGVMDAPLSGLVRCECYGGVFRAEVSMIGFAPLIEGKWICAVKSGEVVESFDCPTCERPSQIDLSKGFVSLICFVKTETVPVASAVSGACGDDLLLLKEIVKRQEQPYCDEAIAEVNYYELDSVDAGGDSRKEQAQIAQRDEVPKDENASCAFQKQNFYQTVKGEVDRLFATYPKEENLAVAIKESKWVKIEEEKGKIYAFGALYEGGNVKYLCYAVPANDTTPPPALQKYCAFVPTKDGGYFVSFQNAETGETVYYK